MNRIHLLLFLSLFAGCDSGVEWRDEPYEVLWIDTGDNRTLALELGEGASIGRVEAEVIAVGSNRQYVVAKQRDRSSGNISYYYIDREKDHRYYNWDDITQGPFSESRYLKFKSELGLPDFTKEF